MVDKARIIPDDEVFSIDYADKASGLVRELHKTIDSLRELVNVLGSKYHDDLVKVAVACGKTSVAVTELALQKGLVKVVCRKRTSSQSS